MRALKRRHFMNNYDFHACEPPEEALDQTPQKKATVDNLSMESGIRGSGGAAANSYDHDGGTSRGSVLKGSSPHVELARGGSEGSVPDVPTRLHEDSAEMNSSAYNAEVEGTIEEYCCPE